jgi:hypothetical protein
LTPFECKYKIVPATPLVFVDAGENLIMANDFAMPSNPPIILVEEEELGEALFNVNVFE